MFENTTARFPNLPSSRGIKLSSRARRFILLMKRESSRHPKFPIRAISVSFRSSGILEWRFVLMLCPFGGPALNRGNVLHDTDRTRVERKLLVRARHSALDMPVRELPEYPE